MSITSATIPTTAQVATDLHDSYCRAAEAHALARASEREAWRAFQAQPTRERMVAYGHRLQALQAARRRAERAYDDWRAT